MSQSRKKSELTGELFHVIFEQSAHGILVWQKGGLVYFNQAAGRILGVKDESLRSWTTKDLIEKVHKNDLAQVARNPTTSDPADIELHEKGMFRIAGDAADTIVEMTSRPADLDGIDSLVLTLVHRDESLDDSIRQHNQLLETMVDSISDPYYVVDAETHQILFANKAARMMVENPVGLPCGVLNPKGAKNCRRQPFCPLDVCKRTGLPTTAEHVIDEPGHEQRFIEMHAYPVFDADGKVVKIVEHQVETTAGRHVELSLYESEKRYSSLFENNHTVMLLIEPNTGAIIDANAAAAAYYRYDREAIKQMNISHIALQPPGDTLLRAGRKALRLQTRHKLEGEEAHDVEIFCGPISVGGQKLIYMIVHDITERSRIERALRERYDYETLAATLATRFIGFAGEELDDGIELALKEIGRFTGVDRCTLYYSADTEDLFNTMYEWHAPRVKPVQGLIGQEPLETFDWFYQRMQNFEAFRMSSLDELPPQAKLVKQLYERLGVGSVLLVPFVTAGAPNGLMGLSLVREGRKWSDNDIMLLRIVGEMIIRSLERRRFEIEVTQSRDRLKDLSAHIQERVENERAGIAREVHDELGQLLTALKFDISLLKNKISGEDSVLTGKTDSMSQLIDQAISSVQRISSELRPVLLDDLGLSAALEWYARSFAERTGIACEIEIDDVQIKGTVATTLFRACQEALTNVGRHSYATDVRLQLKRSDSGLRLSIRDNGIGLPEDKLHAQDSYGLIGLQERVMFLDGSVSIVGKKGEGTAIDVYIPFEGNEGAGA